MKTPSFFIDSADVDGINTQWKKLKQAFSSESVLGITTNPSAMHKVNVFTLKEFESKVIQLSELLSDIRRDGRGTIHVQMPNSNMSITEFDKWAEFLCNLKESTKTKLVLKICPRPDILVAARYWASDLPINVTGTSDAATVLRCLLNDRVSFVSLIPGRMEEKDLNANSHMSFLRAAGMSSRVITGSMRTLKGLENAIRYGTVPTIGLKVFELMTNFEEVVNFHDMWRLPEYKYDAQPPDIGDSNRLLSESFFIQMDGLAQQLYEDFINRCESRP